MPGPTPPNDGVTWKWITGVLLAALITVGGYSYKDLDQRQAKADEMARQRITELEVDLAQEKVRTNIQYTDIQRRLGNMERMLEEILRKRF